MKKLLNTGCLLLIVLLVSIQCGLAQSTSWKGTTNLNWNNAANWTNGIPDATKDVILGDANFTGINQPKVNVVSSCKSLTIGGAVATTLTMTRGLTISGSVTINTNGTFNHPSATAYIGTNFTNNGTYNATAAGSRFIFNGTSQIIGGTSLTAFRSVTINATSTITLASNISVTGTSSTITVNGIINPGANTLTSTGVTKLYGNMQVYGATFPSNYVLTGTTTLYSGSIVEYASTTTDQVVSSAYSYSTLMISGSGTKSLAANLFPLYGKAAGSGKILVNSGTFDISTFTANRATNTPGGEINVANGAVLKVGGASNFPINFATRTFAVSSTVDYNGVDQTVSAQTYGNLLFSTAGIKTAISAFNVTGNFTIANGTFNMNTTSVTHSIAGNFTMTGGAITGNNYTITMNGTTDQTLSLMTSLNKLNINNIGAGSVNLGADQTITGTLNFTKGNIKTGIYDVIMPSSATVTGAAQTTGWVNGNLQKNVTTGAAIFRTFEIGETNYSPVMILFASVSIAGDLTASTRATDHSEINYSGVDPSKDVNRYWAFNNGGILFSSASATFNWGGSDVDGIANTSNFKAGAFNGVGWTLPSVAAPLPTSIQVNGLTSLGDFCVGENISKSTWTGDAMTSDWFAPKNWLGLIPSVANPTLIPDGLTGGRVYPILTGGSGIVNDLTVESGAATLIVSSTLKIAGSLASNSNVTASAGTIEFNGSTAQTIAAGSFTGNIIKNLTVSNDLSMADENIITGTLSVANAKTLTTNDNMTLRSDANGTAAIASLPIDGSGNATAFITGNVSIERYIPARKAWRLLSAPIQSASTATIVESWQEAAYGASSIVSAMQENAQNGPFVNNSLLAPNPNPNPGYGVHIVGGSQANGFDQSPTNSPTLKIYNTASNGFVAFPASPGTFTPIKSYSGYMIYIRGDRSIDLSQGTNAAITATTLRMKGAVNTGKQTSIVNATNFTVLGNPYPAAIDFGTITRTNVKNSFYVWDPKLAGSQGLGGYVTVSWNSGTSSYDVTTSASGVSQYIPSGEAILVESLDAVNPGTVVIKETDKTTNGSDAMFGRATVAGQKLRINLYSQQNDAASLLDGVLTTYDNNNSNQLDNNDVKKLTTESENISLQREERPLAIERRKTITDNDVTFLNIANMKQQQYKFEIITQELNKAGLTAVLKDKFSAELNNTVLNTNGTTEIEFSVTDNPASYAADRFSIVFSKGTIPAVFAFKSIKATLQHKNIDVEWQTENEAAVTHYEIEGSSDGIKFTKLSVLASKTSTGSIYSWFDINAVPGDHYYRIKSSASNAEKKYSNTVKVNIPSTATGSKELVVYPNPVKTSLSLQLSYLEKGMYVIEITNMNGQMVKRQSLLHIGGTFKYTLPVDNGLPIGKYQVKLTDGGSVNLVTSMIKE